MDCNNKRTVNYLRTCEVEIFVSKMDALRQLQSISTKLDLSTLPVIISHLREKLYNYIT